MSASTIDCPICGASVNGVELQRHVNNHLDEDEEGWNRDEKLAWGLQQAGQSNAGNEDMDLGPSHPDVQLSLKPAGASKELASILCPLGCNGRVTKEEWESHVLQHELQSAENSAQHDMSEGSAVEPSQQGRSLGGAGSSTEEDELKGLIASILEKQVRAEGANCEEGIMHLLNRCLSLDSQTRSLYALSGYVDYFASKHQEDLGWGCGWRNIQMLASHLLQRDSDAMEALFRGVGYVPTIAGLQLWLELAWQQGFDTVGAEQLNRTASATRKWIGTTECAALLRSFGFRASIVDFKLSAAPRQHLHPQRRNTEGHKRKLEGLQTVPSDTKGGGPPGTGTGLAWSEAGDCEEEQRMRGSREEGKAEGCGHGDGDPGGNEKKELESGSAVKEGQAVDVDRLVSREHYWDCPECAGRFGEGVQHTHGAHEGGREDAGSLTSRRGVERELQEGGKGGATEAFDTSGRSTHGRGREEEKGPFICEHRGGAPARGAHGDDSPGLASHMRLMEWVWDYFTSGSSGFEPGPPHRAPARAGADPAAASSSAGPWEQRNGTPNAFDRLRYPPAAARRPGIITNKPPLYFQHQGHSRTIVGIERCPPPRPNAPEGVFLLVLDPSQQAGELVQALRAGKGWQRLVKRSVHTLRKAEYQLCYVEPGLASGAELEGLKVLQTVLYSY